MAHSSKKSVCLSIWDGLDGLVRGSIVGTPWPVSHIWTIHETFIFSKSRYAARVWTVATVEVCLQNCWVVCRMPGCLALEHVTRVIRSSRDFCIEVLTSKWIFIRGLRCIFQSIWEILEALAPDNSERLCRSAGPVCMRQDVNCESLGFFW